MIALVDRRRKLPCLVLATLACVFFSGCGGSPTAASSSSPDTSSSAGSTPASETSAATDTVISLAWSANADSVAGYIVYYGPTVAAATVATADLSTSAQSFDPQAPAVSFNAGRDLALKHGDTVCFRLRAYNGANALSDWSAAACSVI